MSASIAIGFGFVPGETAHCFVVTIPRGEEGKVVIAEQLCYVHDAEHPDTSAVTPPDESQSAKPPIKDLPTEAICTPRHLASLSLARWLCIENDVRVEFNRRLRRAKLKSGIWKNGENPLAGHFGKELTLLCWAIEEAELEEIATAYRNWASFTPEERQWLYATIDAATGAEAEPNEAGWRRAIRIALVETTPHHRPVSIVMPPREKPVVPKPAPVRPPTRKQQLEIETRIAQPALPCLDEPQNQNLSDTGP